LKRKPPSEAQAAFDWTESPPEPAPQAPELVSGAALDVEGHRWWAALARGAQEHCIALANGLEDAKLIGDLAKAAGQWKGFAAKHEGIANQMEGGVRG
jgi:hypothetical protein